MNTPHYGLPGLRRDSACVPLITGASGFVGSHIAAALLRRGFHLKLLSRSSPDASALERVRRALQWHGIKASHSIEIIEGDICKPQLGLPSRMFAALAGSITEIIHCASSTSFSEKKRQRIEETNVLGTKHCLDLARAGRIGHFHYISTAYVAGKMDKECPEELVEPSAFYNAYEASKNQAEHMIAAECDRANIGWTIYRPSIIIGAEADGRTLLFNAMYYPVRFFDNLRMMVRRDYEESGGSQAGAMGVKLDPDGRIAISLQLNKGSEAGGSLNLVPIDYVVEAFQAIYFSDSCHGVFNVVNDNPCRLETLARYVEQYYGMRGIDLTTSEVYAASPRSPLDTVFAAFAEIYLPYLADTRSFAVDRVRTLLRLRGKICPTIDYPLFKRCIDYAVNCGWQSPIRAISKRVMDVGVLA